MIPRNTKMSGFKTLSVPSWATTCSSLTGKQGWLPALLVIFGQDGVPVHTVLLKRQVVVAATATLVTASDDAEPPLLPLVVEM